MEPLSTSPENPCETPQDEKFVDEFRQAIINGGTDKHAADRIVKILREKLPLAALRSSGMAAPLCKILRSILLVGGGEFANEAMACYCGSVENADGTDVDEAAKCLVCKAWDAIENYEAALTSGMGQEPPRVPYPGSYIGREEVEELHKRVEARTAKPEEK